MTRPRSHMAAVMTAGLLVLAPASGARAQLTVHDPGNYAQNVLQAARALEQINNQIRSLQNQAQSLANQGKNLKRLPYSSLQTIDGHLGRIGGLMGQAQRLAYDVQTIQREFGRNYAVRPGASDAALIASANARWLNSAAAFQDALKVQAAVVSGLPGARAEVRALMGGSQGAEGVLQAAQAGNQLLALQSQQLSDLTALLAAQGRAAALEQAERAASRAQAKEEFRRFMTRRRGYQPHDVEMFR